MKANDNLKPTRQWGKLRNSLNDIYLTWVNDYLTIERFAEHHGITLAQAMTLIDLAREIYNSNHTEA